MNNKRWLLSGAIAVALFCLFAASRTVRYRMAWDQRITRLQNLITAQDQYSPLASLFLQATKLEVFRMKPGYYTPEPAIGKLNGFEYSAKRSDIDRSLAVRVGALVLDPTTYTGGRKACAFNPTIAFRVWKGEHWVNVVICLGCNQLMVIEDDPKLPINEMGSVRARFRIGGEFDDHRAEFLELARQAFPHDASITSLR